METIESQIYEMGRYTSPIPPLQSNKLKRFQIDYKTTCGKEERKTFLSDHWSGAINQLIASLHEDDCVLKRITSVEESDY